MTVDVVQVPYDSGHRNLRMGAGPQRVLDAGLLDTLSASGHEARLVPIELADVFPTEIGSAFEIARAVKERVTDAVNAGRFPIVLAGNCSAGLGAVAALGQPTVFWFDAHGDLNTPETTRSGFLDGMALSILMGRCWRALAAASGVPAVAEEQVHLIGARDLDPAEEEFLASSSVRTVGLDSTGDLPGRADAQPCYLHVDLDVLDPSVGAANSYSVAGGFGADQLLDLIGRITQENRIGALALTAYDPSVDPEGRIATAAITVARAVVGAAGDAGTTRS